MNADLSLQDALTRRQFLVQAAIVGEALAAPVNMFGQAGRAMADGWLPIKAMPAMAHDVLLAQGKIGEPWLPGGTEKCLWTRERVLVAFGPSFRNRVPPAVYRQGLNSTAHRAIAVTA